MFCVSRRISACAVEFSAHLGVPPESVVGRVGCGVRTGRVSGKNRCARGNPCTDRTCEVDSSPCFFTSMELIELSPCLLYYPQVCWPLQPWPASSAKVKKVPREGHIIESGV